MRHSDHAPTIIAFILTIVVALMLSFIINHSARAEGTTFVTVLRQAGKHSVAISTIASPGYGYSGWGTITDLTDSYVCVKAGDLICIPIDKIVSVKIGDVDSLPTGGQ